jgi:LCP family protein required for cell wall assembly
MNSTQVQDRHVTTKKRTIFILLLIAFIIILLLACLWVVARRPLTARLEGLPTGLASGAGEGLNTLPAPEGFVLPASEAVVIPTPTADPDQETICDGPHLMFIQVAGIDRFNLADVIRIVRADFANQQISVLAIQRATWVSIPHLEDYGITASLINTAHSYGEYFYGENAGITLLSETIAQNFGIRSDRYIDVHYDSFIKAVDAVGGVDITLQESYYDAGTGKYFEPGTHHLNGEEALAYARMRYSDTDWSRMDRQTDLLMSIFGQLTGSSMLPELPGLALELKDDVVTDLSPVEINQLVCLATSISSDSIKFYEIGLDMVTPTVLNDKAHSQVMLPNFDLIRPYVEQFVNGTLP